MRLQQFAFNGGVETVRPPDPPANPLGADAREWLGEPSGEIIAAVAEKRRFIARGTSDWVTRWDAVRAQLAPGLELFGEVGRALTVAGIPAEPGFVSVDERTLRATFHYASRLRARYTVIDFLEGQGALDDAIDAMLAPG
jgi:hypothetical protein